MSRCLQTIVVACFSLTAAARLRAQSLHVADSLVQRGSLEQAESIYYAAVRGHPRDPQARLALGRYLAARGATRVGVTLVEEAVQFGLRRDVAAPILAPLYGELEQYTDLLALPASTLSTAERDRARWLAAHPSRTIANDSTVLMSYAPRAGESALGTATLRVNGRPVTMTIRSSGNGISISENIATAAKVHRFPAKAPKSIVATVDSIGLSRVVMTNVPVTVESQPAGVDGTVSLEFLARFAPTFDPATSRVMLRIGGVTPRFAGGNHFPLMNSGGDLAIVQAGGWAPLRLPQMMAMLRDRRWTLDLRHGQLVVE